VRVFCSIHYSQSYSYSYIEFVNLFNLYCYKKWLNGGERWGLKGYVLNRVWQLNANTTQELGMVEGEGLVVV